MWKVWSNGKRKGKLTMVCKTVWDNLRESVGFGDEFCEGFKTGLGAEYDRYG
jgi:hypothetical protein